jgi:hypothetical protein
MIVVEDAQEASKAELDGGLRLQTGCVARVFSCGEADEGGIAGGSRLEG